MSGAALADYLRAVERLGAADRATRLRIAHLLGLAPPADQTETAPPVDRPSAADVPGPAEAPEVPEEAEVEDDGGAGAGAPVHHSAAYQPAPAGRERPFDLVPVQGAPRATPAWVLETDAVPLPPATVGDPPPPPEPLLNPATARAVLSTALSTFLPDGPLDLAALVRAAASGRAVDAVPRRPRRTMGHPVQLLVDRGEGMLPFRADVRQLTGRVRMVAGADRVSVLGFEGTPLRGAGEGSRRTWMPYRLPPPGTVVAAVTDLGIAQAGRGSGAPPGEWLALARLLRRRGMVLRAFVPYPPERIPAPLRREVRVITWDRSTGARAVHTLLAAPVAAAVP